MVISVAERLLRPLLVHVSWSVTWSGVAGQPLQNGVVRIRAERAAYSRWPVCLRPDQFPGVGGCVFPKPAVLSRWLLGPRWAVVSRMTPSLSARLLPVFSRVERKRDACLYFYICAAVWCNRNGFVRLIKDDFVDGTDQRAPHQLS